jgi:hypothetical protein
MDASSLALALGVPMRIENALCGAIAAAVWTVVGAPSAIAADGVLEINQACVAAGCFDGDTPGFPVQATTAGSYALTSNITVPDANSSGVVLFTGATLDLRGFSITGPTTCVGTPATCTNTGNGTGVSAGANTAIRNGRIKGMGGNGIFGAEGYVRVEDMEIHGNGYSGINGLNGGYHVERCSVHENAQVGIDFYAGQGGATIIRDNSVRDNGDIGIRAPLAIVTGNTVLRNGGLGFFGGTASLSGNHFYINNGGNGFDQFGGSPIETGENICGSTTTCP